MKRIYLFSACFALAMLSGCGSTFQSAVEGFQRIITPTAEVYRQRALDHERRGELLEARLAWHVVARLDPENPSVSDIIKTLNRGIANAVKKHYQDAIVSFNKGDFATAQRKLLIVQRFSPGHRGAREYLKRCLYHKEPDQYKVQRGDSYIRIATRKYNDPTKAYIIAYYNDLDPRKPLLAGKVIRLPALEAKYMVPRADINAMISRAQKALDKKAYDKTIALSADIIEEEPKNQQARRLADQAHFDKGVSMIARQDYLAAIGELKQVSPKFKGRNQAIKNARKYIQQQAVAEKLKVPKRSCKKKPIPV